MPTPVITSGGVDTRQVDPKTMESRLCTGLYFAGEVLDVDAYTGGYNLGLAFATAKAAALHIPVGAEACGGPACARAQDSKQKRGKHMIAIAIDGPSGAENPPWRAALPKSWAMCM